MIFAVLVATGAGGAAVRVDDPQWRNFALFAV